jgi:hypothetical protein
MRWVVKATFRSISYGTDLVPIVYGARWAPGQVWTGAGKFALPGFDSRTFRSVGSIYTNYAIPDHPNLYIYIYIYIYIYLCILYSVCLLYLEIFKLTLYFSTRTEVDNFKFQKK